MKIINRSDFFYDYSCFTQILFFTFALMKKSTNASTYSIYSQESTNNFLTFTTHFLIQKNDFNTLQSLVIILFQEKLPIIYANIRV